MIGKIYHSVSLSTTTKTTHHECLTLTLMSAAISTTLGNSENWWSSCFSQVFPTRLKTTTPSWMRNAATTILWHQTRSLTAKQRSSSLSRLALYFCLLLSARSLRLTPFTSYCACSKPLVDTAIYLIVHKSWLAIVST